MEHEITQKDRKEEKLLRDITDLYTAGAFTICIPRDEIPVVIDLLKDRYKIREGAKIAEAYIERYLGDNKDKECRC